MGALFHSQHNKIDRSLFHMLENLLMCVAYLDKGSRVAKVPCLLGYNSVQRVVEAPSYLFQSVRMLDGPALNHVEHIDFRPHRLRQ